MKSRVTIIGLLFVGMINISHASDSDRIEKLEKEIYELKNRVSELEAVSGNASVERDLSSLNEGWKSLGKWRLLATGLSTDEVKNILGAPQRVDGGDFSHWYYANNGKLTFFNGKLNRWQEPLK